MENILDLYRHKSQLELLVRKQTEKIEKQAQEMQNHLIDAVSAVVEFRDVESGQHIIRIKGFTKILAECVRKTHKEYGLTAEKVEKIVQAAAMHDIGKIAIPDSILLKPGKLTADEFDVMKTHTTKGCGILKSMDFINDKEFYGYCYDICRYHHEKYDGKGYPEGLSGDVIPIAAQIVSLADAYDALVSERVYKSAYSTEKAYEMIVHGECGMYNPSLIECFTMVKKDFEELAKQLHDQDSEEA